MTLNEFLSHLSEARWKLCLQNNAIREEESCHCPLVYVYNKVQGLKGENGSYMLAAFSLDVDPNIALAADYKDQAVTELKELRKKLLQACRLEEVT